MKLPHTLLYASARFACFALLVSGVSVAWADEPAPAKPKVNGRPVFWASGKIVVLPENVDPAPKDYQGSIGPPPLALVKVDDAIVGEIYSAPCSKSPAAEADEMAKSADRIDKITLQERGQTKIRGGDVELTVLRIDLENKIGQPWIFYSLYFPTKTGSTTFKLVVSEKNFKTVLPYFETMFSTGKPEDGK